MYYDGCHYSDYQVEELDYGKRLVILYDDYGDPCETNWNVKLVKETFRELYAGELSITDAQAWGLLIVAFGKAQANNDLMENDGEYYIVRSITEYIEDDLHKDIVDTQDTGRAYQYNTTP